MAPDPLIFDTRYSPLPHNWYFTFYMYLLRQFCSSPCSAQLPLYSVIPFPSLGAGLLWRVATRARKSDIGMKQAGCMHTTVLHEAYPSTFAIDPPPLLTFEILLIPINIWYTLYHTIITFCRLLTKLICDRTGASDTVAWRRPDFPSALRPPLTFPGALLL